MGDKAGSKWVAVTNTFLFTQYSTSLTTSINKLSTQRWCVIYERGRMKKINCTRVTIGGDLIFYPADAGTNTASLSSSNSCSTVSSCAKEHNS
jgi:hypothetical protein